MYENGKEYSHVMIQGQSEKYREVIEKIRNEIEDTKKNGISEDVFERTKKKLYGEYVKGYNDAGSIANRFLQNYFRQVNPLDYFEEFKSLEKEYVLQVLKDVFKEDKKVISIIEPKKA